MTFPEVVGMLGVLAMMLAYLGVVTGRMSKDSTVMHGLNLFGALAVIYSLIYAWNLPVFVIEAAWAAISVFGLMKALRRA